MAKHATQIPPDAYLLIIGAMKCGTTSLFHYLEQHPEVCGSQVKEPHYFAPFHSESISNRRYEDLWQFDAKTHRYALEASTSYTKHPQETGVVERIHSAGLQPTFLYVVRNPFDRIESQFRHLKERNNQITEWPSPLHNAIAISNYYVQLAEYRKYFPASSIHIVNFDELVKRPQMVVSNVFTRLSLSDPQNIDYSAKNLSNKNGHLVKKPLRGRFRDFKRRLKLRLQDNPAKALPSRLSAADRAFVHESLKADMKRFSNEFNFDVSQWGFDAA